MTCQYTNTMHRGFNLHSGLNWARQDPDDFRTKVLMTPDRREGECFPLVGEETSKGSRFEWFTAVSVMQVSAVCMRRGQIGQLENRYNQSDQCCRSSSEAC